MTAIRHRTGTAYLGQFSKQEITIVDRAGVPIPFPEGTILYYRVLRYAGDTPPVFEYNSVDHPAKVQSESDGHIKANVNAADTILAGVGNNHHVWLVKLPDDESAVSVATGTFRVYAC